MKLLILRKELNTLSLKYESLLEKYNDSLEKRVEKLESLDYYRSLCEKQKKEIKVLKRERAK